MPLPAIAPMRDQSERTRVSRCLLHFRASDVEAAAVGGQLAVFSRGIVSTIADAALNSFTLGYTHPAFETVPWFSSVQTMFLRMGSSDRFHFAAPFRPQPFGFYHEFRQSGAMASAGVTLWSIANDAATGARFRVYSNGTAYVVEHDNGSTVRDRALGIAPSAGDFVIQWGYLYADGSVQIWQAVNGAAPVKSTTIAASSLASAWGATARVRLSALGTTAGASSFHRVFKLVPGLPSLAQLQRML